MSEHIAQQFQSHLSRRRAACKVVTVELPCLLVQYHQFLKVHKTFGHGRGLFFQVSESRAKFLRSGETSPYAVAVYGTVVEKLFKLVHSVVDETCIGYSGKPFFVYFGVFCIHTVKLTFLYVTLPEPACDNEVIYGKLHAYRISLRHAYRKLLSAHDNAQLMTLLKTHRTIFARTNQ